jgi:mercuric ion transport protein
MRALIASVVAATVASLCCWGPLVLSLLGAGAFSAAATRFEPYRPYLAALALGLLGAASYSTFRAERQGCADGACPPVGLRRQKRLLWLAAAAIALLLTFPYYVRYLL